jgi:pyruvate carboxylase
MLAGTAEVYDHEMPGGQLTNLQEQAKNVGLGDRWPDIARTYAEVNRLLGDIVKVTPSSKVVGDMALFMVQNNLKADDVLDEDRHLAFPDSVVEMLEGKLGTPTGGWPAKLQKVVLKGRKALKGRPAEHLPKVDFAAVAKEVEGKIKHAPSESQLLSYLMYPKVMTDFESHLRAFSDTSGLPSDVFFYGMKPGREISVDIEPGKTLIVRFLAVGDADPDGMRTVFFELNGQPRSVRVPDKAIAKPAGPARPKADPDKPGQVAAPMPGKVGGVAVAVGQTVAKGDKLLSIEAMKMETAVYAPVAGKVAEIHVKPGVTVESRDLLVTLEPAK